MDNKPLELSGDARNTISDLSQTQGPYRFTTEELRVLRQCNRDSFYQRSLPISTVLGAATYLGIQAGYLRGHVRWGPAPKMVLAVIAGYFLGKFSYQSKCVEKIMSLPNSPLADMLRKRKQRGGETPTLDPSFGTAGGITSFGGLGSLDMYSDIGPQHDLDSSRPYLEGLDDSQRPTLDSPTFEEEALPPANPLHSSTYEELRRKNREEFELKKTQPYRGVTSPEDVPTTLQPRPPQRQPRRSPGMDTEKNKYGDVWED